MIELLKKLALKLTPPVGKPVSAPKPKPTPKPKDTKSIADGPCAASNNAKLVVRSERYKGESRIALINRTIRKHSGSITRRWCDWWSK